MEKCIKMESLNITAVPHSLHVSVCMCVCVIIFYCEKGIHSSSSNLSGKPVSATIISYVAVDSCIKSTYAFL